MGSVFRQRGRSTWMLKYYRDGRPIYESSGTDIKDEAKKILQSREGAIADGRSVLNKNDRSLRFDDAVKRVENNYTINNRRSLANVKGRIRLHLAPVFGGRRMRTIDDDDISAYITTRLHAGAKPATINRELAIVNGPSSWRSDHGLRSPNSRSTTSGRGFLSGRSSRPCGSSYRNHGGR